MDTILPDDEMGEGSNGPAATGLAEGEARRRLEQGEGNGVVEQSSRSLADIVRANVFTRFNALLGSMLVVILVIGPIQDAVFGIILVANLLIGVVQEVRAKMTLDRLAILSARRATVVRDGRAHEIHAADVVLGDLLEAGEGDEIVVDGVVEPGSDLEVSEALLTGESVAIPKRARERVLAGSFVTAGRGRYVATAVGESTYARKLTVEARRFQLVTSELMRGINQILRVVTWLIAPVAVLLVYSQLRANPNLVDAVRGSVAGVVTLIPEGLVLLTTASLALAILRLGRRKVLVQQLPAVELLARADVVCLDKTGTLTEPGAALEAVEPVGAGDGWREALGALARLDGSADDALAPVRAAYPASDTWRARSSVAFSSARRWSGADFGEHGPWVLGAPDVLLGDRESDVQARVAAHSARGRRVLLLGRADAPLDASMVPVVEARALVVMSERVKPDAADTLRRLVDRGVSIKLISGDHPATVAAIASAVGLGAGDAVDCRSLPAPGPELERVAESATVFARVSPEQKRELVGALRGARHTVAMVGDGVNDVLALKEADLGIAMAGGSAAARAVAALVLVDGSFAGVPYVVEEGRRVIGNVERLACLFFTKTVYAFAIAVAVSIAVLPFPFLPRQLTLISAFTIGIPSVVLTFSRRAERTEAGFLGDVLKFSVPAGLIAAVASFSAYALAVAEPAVTVAEERTTATVVVASIGLWLLVRLTRPIDNLRRALVGLMAAGIIASLAVPFLRAFFELDLPRAIVMLAAAGIIAIAVLCLEAGELAANWVARTILSRLERRTAG